MPAFADRFKAEFPSSDEENSQNDIDSEEVEIWENEEVASEPETCDEETCTGEIEGPCGFDGD